MDVRNLTEAMGIDFFTGVPDSQLKPLCDHLMAEFGSDPAHHIVAANEGNAIAIAAGYHLATGKVPVVYMQNSGEGNAVNPITSLLSEEVYGIPALLIIGWRGEPGIHDEPQHVFQGKITTSLLDQLGIACEILDADTSVEEIESTMSRFRALFREGKSAAFVVRKGALSFDGVLDYGNSYLLAREKAIEIILEAAGDHPVVSTTGKPSRELFEIRERLQQIHDADFLTVGSMGHASSIALGIAAQKPEVIVWCVDGDGAALMHMGALGVIGSSGIKNIVHVILNNGSHETVGGIPTAARYIDLAGIGVACGYDRVEHAATYEELDEALAHIRERGELTLLVVDCALGSRSDLGRPTISPSDAKRSFERYLAKL